MSEKPKIRLEDVDYLVKKSKRSKHVSIRITRRDGLVITIPHRFKEDKIPTILQQKKAWVEEQLNAVDFELSQAIELPDQIHLRGIDLQWDVEYRKTLAKQVEYKEIVNELTESEFCIFYGKIDDTEKTLNSLRKWLHEKAEDELIPWLEALSEEYNLPFNGCKIRNQKSRWGSCSSDKIINLNQKLLFLPPEYVEHIMLHELCHTVHMNHSVKFWKLVKSYDANYRVKHEHTRKTAWNKYIPKWADV